MIVFSSKTKLIRTHLHNAYSWKSFSTVLSFLVQAHQFFVIKSWRTKWPSFKTFFKVKNQNKSSKTQLKQKCHSSCEIFWSQYFKLQLSRVEFNHYGLYGIQSLCIPRKRVLHESHNMRLDFYCGIRKYRWDFYES